MFAPASCRIRPRHAASCAPMGRAAQAILVALAFLEVGIRSVCLADAPVSTEEFSALARRAGFRVLEGGHLVLVTDRPSRDGDGVDDFPRLFDEAFAAWCRHYGMQPEAHADWRAHGCLVVDRERFRAAGLLPNSIPDFTNGFCDRGRFWMMDQSSPAYRRHLLLHEGVHAFTLTLRSLTTPPWYTEGIAEMLATHRLEDGRFVATPIPLEASDVEQLGRIELLQGLAKDGRQPSLAEVFTVKAHEHRSLGPYAASWAAVAMLACHPRYASDFTAIERGPLDASLTNRLEALPGWDAEGASRDFAAFLDEVDYGYDFERCTVDWSSGRPLDGKKVFGVESDRGWQNSGFSLEAGRRYTITVTGRCRIRTLPQRVIESEADGISLDWYRSRPLGRLLAAQWVETRDSGSRPRFVCVADGAAARFTAVATGPVFFKINESPGDLADNAGRLEVVVEPTIAR